MCVKTKINTPLHVCSTEQRCDKTRELTPFVRGKRRLCIKKVPWLKLFNPFSISRKLPANGGLLLYFHNSVAVGRGLHALQPLAQMAVSARAFRTVAHVRVYDTVVFCIVFGKNFNIMSAFAVRQSSTCRKKSILARVIFDAKSG